jgi:hypothetical protein
VQRNERKLDHIRFTLWFWDILGELGIRSQGQQILFQRTSDARVFRLYVGVSDFHVILLIGLVCFARKFITMQSSVDLVVPDPNA